MNHYSIKDIQRELNISEKTARRLLKQHNIKPIETDTKTGAHYYSVSSVKTLGQARSMTRSDDRANSENADNNAGNARSVGRSEARSKDDPLIETLQSTIEDLRAQLSEKDKQIDQLQILLLNSQQVQKTLLGYTKDNEEPKEKTEEPKKGFFSRFFGI